MSRYAVLSDVHGNLPALAAVLQVVKEHQVDEVFCLGDVFGYYPEGPECLALLDEVGCTLLMGNHEAMLAGLLPYSAAADEVHRISDARRSTPLRCARD